MGAGGRPMLFNNAEEFDSKVNEYFNFIKGDCHMEEVEVEEGVFEDTKVWDRMPEPATITGLCLFLGFESRQSFYDYEKIQTFSYAVKRARLRVENEYEKTALYAKNATFHIFALKNLGWKDRQELDHTTNNKDIPSVTVFELPNNKRD